MNQLRVLGEDLSPAVSVAATGVGVIACALWLLLDPTWEHHESRMDPARAPAAPLSPAAKAVSAPAQRETNRAAAAAAAPASVCEPLMINFPSAISRLAAQDARRLAVLAARLATEPEAKLLVRGHADGVGADAANLALSFQRAEAVAQSLIDRGIERTRISVQGFGEYAPLDGAVPSESINRRATIDVRGARRCLSGDVEP